MKKTLTLILLFSEILLFAQSENKLKVIGNRDNGIKQGVWNYYIDGVIWKKENYLNGKKNGLYKVYYGGKLNLKGNFKNGLESGKWSSFYDNGSYEGKPNFEIIFTKDGAAEVTVTKFYYNEKQEYTFRKPYYAIGSAIVEEDEDDNLIITSFEAPEFHGKYKGYYKGGKLFCSGEYTNGKQSGIWTYYYKNGEIWEKGEYYDDHEIGLWKEYHENGELSRIVRYDNNGNKIDTWK